ERRRAHRVRRADARRLRGQRSAPRLAVRRRFEPGQDRPADHSEDRAEPGAAAAGGAGQTGGRMSDQVRASGQKPLLPWTLGFLRPYRGRVALLAFLLITEIILGALQPWPFSIVIDYVLGDRPWPDWIAPYLAFTAGHKFAMLITVVISGVILQVVNQFVSAY